MKTLAYIFFYLIAFELSGQAHFSHLSVEDGLSQNSILAILQDSRGYLWLGTEDGLNRYDGYTFRQYFEFENDSLGLAGDKVWSLIEDDSGKIWISHGNGISYFDMLDHRFVNVLVEENSFMVSSHIDDNGNLWFGSAGGGLITLNKDDLEVTRYTNSFPVSGSYDSSTWNTALNYITSIIQNEDHMLVGTRGAGFWKFRNGLFSRLSLSNDKKDFFDFNVVWSIVKDSLNNLYAGTMKGLAVISPDYDQAKIYLSEEAPDGPGKFPIAQLCFDSDRNKLWMASYGGGLLHFDLDSELFYQYSYDKGSPGNLSGNLAYSLLLDNNENLWIGTWGGGLNKLSRNARNIYKYNEEDGFEDVFITGISNMSENSVLVSTYTGGIYRGTKSRSNGKYIFNKVPSSDRLAYQYIKSIYVGRDNVWLALEGGGVAGMDKNFINSNWIYYQKIHSNPNSLNQQLVETVLEDQFGDLLVGTWGSGLKKIFTKKKYGSPGSIQNIESIPGNPNSLSGLKVLDIYIDQQGYLWVGTENGLNRSRMVITQDFIPNDFLHFGNQIVHAITAKGNKIWVGTDHGLFQLKDEKLIQDERLSAQVIYSIVIDDHSTLWVTTNQGLFALPENRPMQRFTYSDGLQSNEFNIRAAALLGDDIIVGGIAGINTFNANNLLNYIDNARAVVSAVTVNNERIIDDPTSVSLNPTDKIIEFEFTSFDFTNPKLNQFEYRLLEFDEDWIYNPSSRSATYTNLDAGNYSFELRLKNASQSEVFKLPLVVKPPFWRTPWAYGVYGILFISAILVARKIVVNRERLNARLELEHLKLTKLKELDDFKSKFFANISHEFRTPLTLILGNTDELLEEGQANKEALLSIQHNSHAVLNLVNQLLDLSKIDSGKLNLQVYKLNIVHFISGYVEMFESLAHQKEIELDTNYTTDKQDVIADPSILEKIITNLLSNAIKYSRPGDQVHVHVDVEGNELIMKVEDTGVGISAEDLDKIFDRFYRVAHHGDGTGIGLALTKELVSLHKGKIQVVSRQGEGSCFEVRLPIDESSYPEIDSPIMYYDEVQNELSLFTGNNFEASIKNQMVKDTPMLLIVEDNVELQQYLERNLQQEYSIILASTGDDGLVKSNLSVPDIIISDWMMPGMDGEEMCKRIKSNELTSHIPIVMLTAKADLDSKITGLGVGADDYITKPFEMRELKARLSNLLTQRKKLKEKYGQLSLATEGQAKTLSVDDKFLNRLYALIEDNLSNPKMNVDWLSREMGVSRVQLHRKVKALLGKAVSELLKEYKLKKAADLLRNKAGNVSEIAYQLGFNNLSYFTKVFKDRYQVTPSEFA